MKGGVAMESIEKSLQGLVKRQDFQERFNQLRKTVLADPKIKEFIQEHSSEIDRAMIDRSLVKLYEFTGQSKNCEQCSSFEQCKNLVKGYTPSLVIQGKTIDCTYNECAKKIAYEERKRHESLVKSMYIPKEVLRAELDNIALDDKSRLQVVSYAHDFVEQYSNGKQMKGLYLHGPFGVGKTYVISAIANELAAKNIPSMIVYVPEFMRELKGSIHDQSLNEKVDAVKNVRVLMLDDIGAESMSSWMRDDILGAILQYRMLENLPTFFTSNFDLDGLQHHLTYSQRGEMEEVKALRIMERIKYLATPMELEGKNRRLEN